ncbi:MAG: AAA family ATPase [Dissulfurispiraceae bacterium]|jgi:ATP-dependent 26S proteasome regulatory subunit
MEQIQKNKQSMIEEVVTYVSADYKLLYLYTSEELKTLQILKEVAKETDFKRIYTYDIVNGLQCDEDKQLRYHQNKDERTDIFKTLDFIIRNIDVKSFVVFKDIHSLFQTDQRLVRAFKNCINELLEQGDDSKINIFLVSSVLYIPTEIEKEVTVIDIPLPSRGEIEKTIIEMLTKINVNIGEGLKVKLIEALNGLSETEVNNVINYCLQQPGYISGDSIGVIVQQKQQLIKKGGVLEFVSANDNLEENIGGLGVLKEWVKNKKKIFDKQEKAKEFGVDIPKGLLLFGMPGCGKSLAAKAIANYFEMPLLRLDMGMILGPYVGQSEENMRKAIKLAEAISPSVLWIDEMEKAFAGVRGGTGGSSEVSLRIFGTILTWMQEKTKPVFVVATANSITGMPPEFLRKGRFDEIFFVDFPKGVEIKDIFNVHLKKRINGTIKDNDFLSIKAKMDEKKESSFSGADIEALVQEVLEDAFIHNPDSPAGIEKEDYIEKLMNFKPLSETMKDVIDEMRQKKEHYGFKEASKLDKRG